MLKGKQIILGVTGGIAAYKAADLVSRLGKEGALVEVIMTEAAKEFINPLTFQTMSNHPVHTSMFNEIDKFDVEHISLAKKADMLLVVPATANTIGKIANGIADNLLTTVIMATKAKVAFAPAMNTGMYTNPLYQENVEKLTKLGYDFIEPSVGLLACGDVGAGKMEEPAEIVKYLIDYFTKKDLKCKKITVTAGATIESMDPIRFLSNHSSGKMGYAIARAARSRGAEVTLISAASDLDLPRGVNLVEIETTQDMFHAVGEYFDDTDMLIKAAAPADYRPKNRSDIKIKKSADDDEVMMVEFVRNPDILKYYGNKKKDQVVIGFAAETNQLIENARKKVVDKNMDFVVANNVTIEDVGFKSDNNLGIIIDKDGKVKELPKMSKDLLANEILDKALVYLKK